MSLSNNDIQFLRDKIQNFESRLEKIELQNQIIIQHLNISTPLPERICWSCNKKYNKRCSCGCGEYACSCLKCKIYDIDNPGEVQNRLYFYELRCAENMENAYATSAMVKHDLRDFIKHYKSQNC
jgi:hypothetical protein